MKIESKHLSFVSIAPWFGRHRYRFYGNSNTMQLLETALVIEGYQKTIGYPLIDILVQWAMCEWTTVTVPYSRIVKCRYSRRWLVRSAVMAFIILPLLILIALSFVSIATGADVYAAISMDVFLIALIAVMLWVMFRFFPARYSLVFRRSDGRRGLTRFRIKSRALRQAFEQKLESNRKAALVA
jgi:hypothetical protein